MVTTKQEFFPRRTLQTALDGLMRRYSERVPEVKRVFEILESHSLIRARSDIENDHIAFRTLGLKHLGINSFEKIFLHCGYQKREQYHFEKKKLDAYWYSPPTHEFPRVFISELRVGDLSDEAQKIIDSYVRGITVDPVDSIDLNSGAAIDEFLHRPLWRTPTWADFSRLNEESEYAAWVIYNRYYLNHFTISVHNLPAPYNDLSRFNELLESAGIRLNDSGGKIKESPDGLLLQSSTVASLVRSRFGAENGEAEYHNIAGSYVEFAERRVLPEFASLPSTELRREHRREGFEAGNADKIFESTFNSQTHQTSDENQSR